VESPVVSGDQRHLDSMKYTFMVMISLRTESKVCDHSDYACLGWIVLSGDSIDGFFVQTN